MSERMDTLETHFLYLQKTVDELSAVVIEQQKEIRELRLSLNLLGKKLAMLSLSPTGPEPDEKPPHY